MSEFQDLSMLDVGWIDTALLDGQFEDPSSGFAAIPAGEYHVTFPEVVRGREIEVAGRKALEFDLDPLTIAETDPTFGGRFIGAGNGSKARISTLNHYGKATNDVWDLMIAEGQAERGQPPTAVEIVAFMDYMGGRTTTNPVKVEPTGYYKGDAAAVTLKAADGSERPAGKTCSQPKNGYVNVYASAFGRNDKFTGAVTVIDAEGNSHEVTARAKVAGGGFARGWLGA